MPVKGTGTRLDPVCNMDVTGRDVEYKVNYRGREYYFCSYDCMKKFEENPEKYLSFHSQESAV
ncbi:Small protein often clustered with efflux pumps [Methanosarcina horonobensis HB-1 = JCM 15518]|uniref:Small protein often clustered with efflux pumps n=1 Tax=Methanosarcina horonobensis HB-1 = JCM 15518 TaxID=1434110 RepID=A0A0E3WTY4_9EURY|nr:YHS domain-containing protein [Methanosarcina horonobensis]AKB76865.1 Small protein often clustered with efflux pumps [Methanosarcina horonobensis HB-1 = JCM 15518]